MVYVVCLKFELVRLLFCFVKVFKFYFILLFIGNPFLLQACLRLDSDEIPKDLELGREYRFCKRGHRLYQIMVPMDLRSDSWEFYGRVVIIEYTVGKNRTEGTFVLIKEFSDEEREVITRAYVSDEEVDSVVG